MGDYGYSCYSLQKTGVVPFGHTPFYNSSILWSYKPSMTSSPPSSVIMTSEFPASRRQAMSEVGVPCRLRRSETSVTTRSMPQESSNHSVPWYQRTNQAINVIPVMFEARANKDSSRDLGRYNRWQSKVIEPTPTVQYLSLPTKQVAVFEATRSQTANNSAPSQSEFYKLPSNSADLNQRHNPSACTSSASASTSDVHSADSHLANSRVLLKASPTANSSAVNVAKTSSSYANPRFVAEPSPLVRRKVESTRPAAEHSLPRPIVDQSVVPKSGIYLKHTASPSRPSENALERRPGVDLSTVQDQRHSNFSSSSLEVASKDFCTEPSGKIKFNPLFESGFKHQVGSNLSSAVPVLLRTEDERNRHLARQRIPMDGHQECSQPGAKVNENSTFAVDEKQIIKDAFRFLDDFDD